MHILRKHVFDLVPEPKLALLISRILLAFLLLNPYLIQATTLLLTDSISSSFVAVAIFYIIFEKQKGIIFNFCWFLLIAASMIRPGMLYFIPVGIVIYTIRFIGNKKTSPDFLAYCKPLSYVFLLGLLLVLPQIFINQNLRPAAVKFPITVNLLQYQKSWGCLYLKYATRVDIPPFAVRHKNIFNPKAISDPMIFRKNMINNYMTKIVHIFAMADQGVVDTYMTTSPIKKAERIGASIFYYLYLFFAMLGLLFAFSGKNITRTSKLDPFLVVLPIVIYLFFYADYAVESRFFYPVMLLLSYFCAIGIANAFYLIRGSRTDTDKGRFSYKYACLFISSAIIFETVSFAFSYWLDSLIS